MSQTRPFTCFLTGETSLLIRCASHLLTQGHNVAGIFSPDVDVNEWAGQQDMTCFTNQQDWLAALQTQDFDYLFSIVNSWIIPPEVLNLPRKGAINFHDSPLPRYAGVNSTTHAIRNDEKQHGISWHQIDEGIDTGDILKQVPVDIAPDDTALSLNLKCYEAAYSAFTELVTALAEDRAEAVKQDLSQRSYYGLWSRPEAACALDWTQPAEQLDALVRALDMGGYRNGVGLPKCVLGDQVLIPAKTKVLENPSNQSPGTLVALEQEAIHVATASKDLAIRQLSSLTGEILPAADWARRCGLQSGHKLDFPDAQQRQN